ncbi:MAG: tungstate ABC transporter substrate-binding protein WtpA [Bacteroidetes bacterium HGW-Bacteroidetes-4]|jgi:molybdate/tungstate transport system substrate-binding protein|nr:MAG: tungstate ABC transporter substrate-binding protein WtpA [Bacteroidetes bacterium HGW-Bacteroidetes-4]
MNRLIILSLTAALLFSCQSPKKNKLIIFHAGSLSVPLKQVCDSFQSLHPEVNIELEAAGSRTCARKITDLHKPCDIMASADYKVIDNLLIPGHASWNLKFASNEMTITYHEKSYRQADINAQNWFEILLDPKVRYGRADPNSDPCGYRSVLVSRLAEAYYQRPGLADSLLAKDQHHIRPKETDLLALLETGVIDYLFIYRSVAEQHRLKYLLLPDSINLKKPEPSEFYRQATVTISGKKPGETITQYGEPMIYGITQLSNAPNPELAQKFLEFFFTDSAGIKIMKKNGQPSVIPASTASFEQLPAYLKPFALMPENR